MKVSNYYSTRPLLYWLWPLLWSSKNCSTFEEPLHNFGRQDLVWHRLHNYGISLGVVHSYSLGELSPSTEKEKNKRRKEKKKEKEKRKKGKERKKILKRESKALHLFSVRTCGSLVTL